MMTPHFVEVLESLKLNTNISPEKAILTMIFLFQRWDMLDYVSSLEGILCQICQTEQFKRHPYHRSFHGGTSTGGLEPWEALHLNLMYKFLSHLRRRCCLFRGNFFRGNFCGCHSGQIFSDHTRV